MAQKRAKTTKGRKAMTTKTLEYALVDYDVKDVETNKAVYAVIYREMFPISLPYTESVDLVNLAHAHKVEQAFQRINGELRDKGLKQVEFHITHVGERSFEQVRNRSINKFKELCAQVAKSLIDRIDKIEEKFNEKTDDVNESIAKRNDAISKARRELETARGLALLFLLEGETAAVVRAEKIIDDAAEARDAFKKENAERIKKLREAARKKEKSEKTEPEKAEAGVEAKQ